MRTNRSQGSVTVWLQAATKHGAQSRIISRKHFIVDRLSVLQDCDAAGGQLGRQCGAPLMPAVEIGGGQEDGRQQGEQHDTAHRRQKPPPGRCKGIPGRWQGRQRRSQPDQRRAPVLNASIDLASPWRETSTRAPATPASPASHIQPGTSLAIEVSGSI